jgi:hypothetical protein
MRTVTLDNGCGPSSAIAIAMAVRPKPSVPMSAGAPSAPRTETYVN